MNKICLIGRISNDLEVKTTSGGKSVCKFDLAVRRAFSQGETDFLSCVVWNETAENLAKYQKKGDRIAVEGALQTEKYTDKDQKTRKKYYIIVSNIEYLNDSREKCSCKQLQIGDDLPF